MDTQSELQKEMDEATPRFVNDGIELGLKKLYPNIPAADVPKIVKIIHDDLRQDVESGDLMENLAPYELGPVEEVHCNIVAIEMNVGGALSGLGIDILESHHLEHIHDEMPPPELVKAIIKERAERK